ncbi:MAG TPA: hypothetical protein VFY75_10885 [Solirubrobacterales bacterium]|nr:hypothetical protein [Solirubrobacterales bacterium]
MSEIHLTRQSGFRVDSGREYKILIDRKSVGSIRVGEAKAFTVPPGQHELQLKQDWAASEKLQFDLGDNERAQFECAPRVKENDVGIVNGLRAIYWITLGCRRYIDLRQGHDLALVDEPNRWLQMYDGPKLFGVALVIGIAFWVFTGQSVVALGVVVAAMAIVVAGPAARRIGKGAGQISEGVEKRQDG